MTDLGTILINLGTTFPYGVKLTFVFLAVFGIWISGLAVIQAYQKAQDENRSKHSYGAIAATFVIGAACCVAPFIVWRFANTIALGGEETTKWLSYSPNSSGTAVAYCKDTQFAITGLFMFFGAIAVFYGFSILYGMAQSHRVGGAGQSAMFIFGGVACMFINDIALIIGNTINMNVGIQNVCSWLGT